MVVLMFFDASERGKGTLGLAPFARLTIRDGRLFLHRWDPRLAVRGKEHAFYEALFERAVLLADLYRDDSAGQRELFIRPLPGHELDEPTRQLVQSWAEGCGVERLWFGDEACVDLLGQAAFGAVQRSQCVVCGWELEDSSLEIWHWTARNRRTTSQCQVCGSTSLPQAVVDEDEIGGEE